MKGNRKKHKHALFLGQCSVIICVICSGLLFQLLQISKKRGFSVKC